MKLIRLLIALCAITCTISLWAAEIIMSVEVSESWLELASRFKKYDLLSFRSVEEYSQELVKWNGHIRGVQPEVGDQIYLRPPHSPYISYNYAPPLPKAPFFSRSFNLIASYSASYAQNSEVMKNEVQVDYKLNSPVTFSLLARKVLDAKNSLSFSGYGSYTTSSKVAGFSENSVTPPLEIGATLYHEFGRASWGGFKFYYGGDLERFSTLNDQSIEDYRLDFVANHVAYATAGMSLYLQKMFIKISGSQSLFSHNEIGHQFSGYKAILFLGRLASSSLTYSAFAKYHNLSSDQSELSGVRFGLGFGYRFY